MPTINVTNATVTGTITYDDTSSPPPNGGGGSGVTIDFVRSVASHNPVFCCQEGEVTTCNHLVVLGTAASPVNVSVDSGPPIRAQAGSGNEWYAVLDELTDGQHTITAGDASFKFTIAPTITGVTIGSQLRSASLLGIDGNEYEVQNDNANSKACVATDGHTLRFELRPGDNWSSYNRTEVASHKQFDNNQTMHLCYEFQLDPAYGHFANASGSCMTMQIHENNNAGNKTPVLFGMTFYPDRNDEPTWQHDKGNDSYAWLDGHDVGITTLKRGVWHKFEAAISPKDHTLKVELNGTTVWDTGGLAGTGSKAAPYYHKCGLYRGSTGDDTETQGIMFRNIQTRYT